MEKRNFSPEKFRSQKALVGAISQCNIYITARLCSSRYDTSLV